MPEKQEPAFEEKKNQVLKGLGEECPILESNGTPERGLLRELLAGATVLAKALDLDTQED